MFFIEKNMLIHKFKIKTIFFIIAIISITTILINNSIFSIHVNSIEQPREYGITRMYFPNGTIVHIEYEALNREVGRNENGIIYETIPESIKMIKYEVIHTESAPPQAIIYGYRIFTGNPAKTWVYKQISFGYTFSVVPVVTLGENLAYGE